MTPIQSKYQRGWPSSSTTVATQSRPCRPRLPYHTAAAASKSLSPPVLRHMAYAGSGGHICQCLSRILTLRGNATVTVSGDRRRTGREFVEGVARLARGLVELGVKSGDVVAIAALNSEWYLEWLLAVSFVGGIVAPLNYRWSLEEAEQAVEHVKPVMLAVDESCRKWAVSMEIPYVRLRILIGQSPYILSRSGPSGHDNGCIKRPAVELLSFNFSWSPRDIALICFTSGTTGKPKGVAISHTALIVQALAKIAIVGYGEDDVYLHTAPLCHIGGISSCIANLMTCACHVFISKFDARGAIRAIEQNQVTSFITVPTMMAYMVQCLGEFRWKGGDSVRKILNGGGNLSADLISGAIHIFPYSKLISAYGMTEACSSITFTTLHDPASSDSMVTLRDRTNITKDPHRHHLGGTCVGKPPFHIELQIEGTESNDGFSTSGRILTRGPHVMVGYWDHDGNPSSIVPVDWLDTGDLGWIDCSGFLWLLGRRSGRIKSGGENVYPEEVEAVLSQHPGVASVVVLGIPDYPLAELVTACVCLKENWRWIDGRDADSSGLKELSKNLLQEHCRQRNLTGFKIPKIYIPWRRPLPYTTSGKVKREEVRKEVLSYLHSIPSSL